MHITKRRIDAQQPVSGDLIGEKLRLELPLTNEVAAAIVKHLKRTPPPEPHRRIFLRMHAPIGLLKPTAISEAFHSMVRKSRLSIPLQAPHCLRHYSEFRTITGLVSDFSLETPLTGSSDGCA